LDLLSPTTTTKSVWGSQSSIASAVQSLDASVANMRRPTYVPEYRTSTPPPAGDEVQLGVTNRGAINHIHSMSGPQQTASPQAQSDQTQGTQAQHDQVQQTKHNRFPSFNPARPAGSNFPEYVAGGQGMNAPEQMQSPVNQTQQLPSRNGQEPHIHAPQPSAFKPSHAFRELATPTLESDGSQAASVQQQSIDAQHRAAQGQNSYVAPHPSAPVQQTQGPIQRPPPSNVDARTRGLMSPVHMDRPSAVPTMPSMMRNMNLGGPPVRDPVAHGYNNMTNGFTGGGHLTNSAHLSGYNMSIPQQYGSFHNGFQFTGNNMNATRAPQMHVPQMNAPQMGGSHFQNQQMYNPQMGRHPMPGQQMNQMYNNMPSNMHNNQRIPAMPAQADPFVDARSPVYANRQFVAPTNYQPFTAAPQPAPPAPVSSPISNAGAAYTWDRGSQQINSPVSIAQQPQRSVVRQPQPIVVQQPQTTVVQQPQTNAARMAEAIRSGNLHQLECRSPPQARGLTSPGGERPGNELVLQQPVVRSQAVMAPEVRADPAWVDPNNRALPSLDDVYEHMPFVDTAVDSRPSINGVIKIGNIPYGTTKNEVIAALGRSARIASQPKGTPHLAIHIIMERSTGKTMDTYVELDSVEEAKMAIATFQQRCLNNRHPRIGDRHIEMELSSQEALMKELFPRAKCVKWEGQTPRIYTSTEAYNSGFQCFVTSEELVMITKHAETPQRSPFALRCVHRTYETMISLMHKYPWHVTEFITIRERTAIFSCAMVQLRVLIGAVSRNSHPQHLHRGLLQEYLTACLSNPGFTVQHKTYMVVCAANEGYSSMLSMIPFTHIDTMIGSWWNFEALSKNPKSSDPLLTYVISLLCSATDPEGSFARTAITDGNSHIGDVDPEIAAVSSFGWFAPKYERQKELCSLKEAAEAEWRALYEALSRVLPSAHAAITFGEAQQQVGGAEEDAAGFETGQLALPGLEQREDILLG
jgi:hypothetical protein